MTRSFAHRPKPGPVVAGVDGYAHDEQVVVAATDQAARLGTRLQVVHVLDTSIEPPSTSASQRCGEPRRPDLCAARDQLRRRVSDFIGIPLPSPYIELRAAVGDPATLLLFLARDAILLIVGTRSKPSPSPVLLGGVSQQVAEHASCPVLFVPIAVAGEASAVRSGRSPAR